MRLLVVTHHYFDPAVAGEGLYYSSRVDPLARIAAVNAMLIAFHRHFGPRRHGEDATQRFPGDSTPERVLDIVILQIPGKGILQHAGLDPSTYTLELWNGPAVMLGFETQRVLRDRIGAYDYYAVVEDDMVIHDPLFFEKLAWFENQFGVSRLLLPLRYEMAQSGVPAIVSVWPPVSPNDLRSLGMRRDGQPTELAADWHGKRQTFALPKNPHVGGFFVSDAQLRHWAATPWLYDRDSSFVGPLESAMCLALGRAFATYQPAAPDPFFLSIEHWGTRFARNYAPAGVDYGDTPLLAIAHSALRRAASSGTVPGERPEDAFDRLMTVADQQLNALAAARDHYAGEFASLIKSRSKLFKALAKAMLRRSR